MHALLVFVEAKANNPLIFIAATLLILTATEASGQSPSFSLMHANRICVETTTSVTSIRSDDELGSLNYSVITSSVLHLKESSKTVLDDSSCQISGKVLDFSRNTIIMNNPFANQTQPDLQVQDFSYSCSIGPVDSLSVLAPLEGTHHQSIRAIYEHGGLWGDALLRLLNGVPIGDSVPTSYSSRELSGFTFPKLKMDVDSIYAIKTFTYKDNYRLTGYFTGQGVVLFSPGRYHVRFDVSFNRPPLKGIEGTIIVQTHDFTKGQTQFPLPNKQFEAHADLKYTVQFLFSH